MDDLNATTKYMSHKYLGYKESMRIKLHVLTRYMYIVITNSGENNILASSQAELISLF